MNFDGLILIFLLKERGNDGVEHSDRLYSALMKHVRESYTKLKQNILEEFRKSEQRDEEMMTELQEEVMRLQEMNSKLKKLSQSEDHLHLLQVSQCTASATIQKRLVGKTTRSHWGKWDADKLETVELRVSANFRLCRT